MLVYTQLLNQLLTPISKTLYYKNRGFAFWVKQLSWTHRSSTYKRFYLSTHASIAVAFTHALPQVQPLAKGSVDLGSSGWQANPESLRQSSYRQLEMLPSEAQRSAGSHFKFY